jgi:hypothetical protein
VQGRSTNEHGVFGESAKGAGVVGISEEGYGVYGRNTQGKTGVAGESDRWVGVHGKSSSTEGGAGVWGEHTADGTGLRGSSTGGTGIVGTSDSGVGVWGASQSSSGVGGQSTSGIGVHGVSTSGNGVRGDSTTGEGVRANTNSPTVAALAAYNNNPEGKGAAVYGKKAGSQGHAGFFDGDVHVTRKLTVDVDIVLSNADCAEDFNIGTDVAVEAGTVMVLGDEGALFPSQHAYDKRVAGVVSGAGNYKPGIVLDKQESQEKRQPIALLGKVYCKVDAQYGAIEVGDLLTTSDTSGYAMKVSDPFRGFGAVIGKALRPLAEGQSLIPILIALQ